MSFQNLAHDRYSCRSFDPDLQVSTSELDVLLDVVRAAPSAMNRQPYRVWLFEDADDLAKVDQCTPCRYGAPLVALFGATSGESFVRTEDDLDYAQVDAAIATTHYLLAATDLGLATCWVGRLDPSKVHELFPQTAGCSLVALVPTGHPAPDGGPSERHELRKKLDEFVTRI